jgi:aryl-alcohol dehydrogenase-like predicted oxidoreductase
MVIATKGRFPTSDDPNGHGLSRRHLAAALDGSLRRLGVEGIDLYQLHGWDPLTPVEETLRFLDDAAQAGKIRYFGLSNFLGYQIQKYVDLADSRGLIRPVTVQPQYNLMARAIEGELDLSEEETRLLDAASDPGAPDYLYGERGQTQRDRRISGGRF